MANQSFVLQGSAELKAALAALGPRAVQAARAALFQECERILTIAESRTPVKRGVLRGSGTVTPPVVHGATVVVELGFGGAAAPYAVFVHENLTAHHPVGEAKFLERPVLEAAPQLPTRLATALRAALERGGG